MTKLKVGTTQAYLNDELDVYGFERWDGKHWVKIQSLSFDTKKQADQYGFEHFRYYKK